VEAIEAVGGTGRFKLVHDTFHHALAHGGPLFADHTGIIHISGVVDPAVTLAQMRDAHRILVNGADRLGNIDQITQLQALGYTGPISFEAFAPEVHAATTLDADLAASIHLIREGLARKAA
jgi:2-keto-myo-inositol isomerase